MSKIALGMSGGIDSSFSIHLLQQAGWDVIGIHLQLIEQPESDIACADAKRVADFFNIPFHTVKAYNLFEKEIMHSFVEAYRKGETPNPCIHCNRQIKFGYLWQVAQRLGCSHLATGHYARILNGKNGPELHKALDATKDQCYFLYRMPAERLNHVVFPLGDYYKQDIREKAKTINLPIATKKDSQDICFIPNNDYIQWLSDHVPTLPNKGTFIDTDGNILGNHSGHWRYTIGQRKGLGISFGYPAYVSAINAVEGTVTIAEDTQLWRDSLTARNLNWLLPLKNGQEGHCLAKIRSRDEGSMCHWKLQDDTLYITFNEPVRAITPGQSVVLYEDTRVLGGGIIQS